MHVGSACGRAAGGRAPLAAPLGRRRRAGAGAGGGGAGGVGDRSCRTRLPWSVIAPATSRSSASSASSRSSRSLRGRFEVASRSSASSRSSRSLRGRFEVVGVVEVVEVASRSSPSLDPAGVVALMEGTRSPPGRSKRPTRSTACSPRCTRRCGGGGASRRPRRRRSRPAGRRGAARGARSASGPRHRAGGGRVGGGRVGGGRVGAEVVSEVCCGTDRSWAWTCRRTHNAHCGEHNRV